MNVDLRYLNLGNRDGTEPKKNGKGKNAGLESKFFFFPSRKRVNDHANELLST